MLGSLGEAGLTGARGSTLSRQDVAAPPARSGSAPLGTDVGVLAADEVQAARHAQRHHFREDRDRPALADAKRQRDPGQECGRRRPQPGMLPPSHWPTSSSGSNIFSTGMSKNRAI